VHEIVSETLVHGKPLKRLLYTDPETRKKIESEKDIPFFGKQVRAVFARTGRIDPTEIDDYIAEGCSGYSIKQTSWANQVGWTAGSSPASPKYFDLCG
jgi:hypothetical protein